MAAAAAGLLLIGCGGGSPRTADPRLPSDYLPLPPGRTAAYRLPPTSAPVRARAPIARLRCRVAVPARFAVHLELYADRLVVPVPGGIGIAPPLGHRGVYVTGGACRYPVFSREPTGVFSIAQSGLTLGDLFAVWGQPLSRHRLAGFAGPVRAYVAGRPWPGDPRAIPLRPNREIVLERGGYVPPHPAYLFPPGR